MATKQKKIEPAAPSNPPPVQSGRLITVPRQITSASRLLDTAAVCAFLSISDDTLDRLLADPDASFPRPIKMARGKRHWTLGSIEQYVRRLEQRAQREAS